MTNQATFITAPRSGSRSLSSRAKPAVAVHEDIEEAQLLSQLAGQGGGPLPPVLEADVPTSKQGGGGSNEGKTCDAASGIAPSSSTPASIAPAASSGGACPKAASSLRASRSLSSRLPRSQRRGSESTQARVGHAVPTLRRVSERPHESREHSATSDSEDNASAVSVAESFITCCSIADSVQTAISNHSASSRIHSRSRRLSLNLDTQPMQIGHSSSSSSSARADGKLDSIGVGAASTKADQPAAAKLNSFLHHRPASAPPLKGEAPAQNRVESPPSLVRRQSSRDTTNKTPISPSKKLDQAQRQGNATIAGRGSIHTSPGAPTSTSHQRRTSPPLGVMPCNLRRAKHLTTARSAAAHDAFKKALLQGMHKPQCAKLGLVGAARAGKTSTLRALAGLPLRADEESTVGLAVWQVTQELLTPGHGLAWQLQEARAHKKAASWDNSVARYVADVISPNPRKGASDRHGVAGNGGLDANVIKRMPVELIAERLEEDGHGAESLVLETYDFGGQEIYYAMHHLFLTDFGLYLACIDLSTIQSTASSGAPPSGDGGLREDGGWQDAEKVTSCSSFEALEWWLASIVINAPSSPVAIVGTHDDCLDRATRSQVHRLVHDRIVALCTKIPELNARLQVNEEQQLCFFPVDNSATADTGAASVQALRKALRSMAGQLLDGPLCEAVPLRWAHFWAVVQRASTSDEKLKPLCRMDDLWKRCSQYGFESRGEMVRFLEHFRRLGAILYFPEAQSEDLQDVVCFDPSWVADAAASVLLAKDKVLQGCTKHSAELQEKGLLHCQLLDAIWRQSVFRRHKNQLIELLQVLDLLMPWGHDRQSVPVSQHAEMPQVFLVPALLPQRPQRLATEIRSEQQPDEVDGSIVLYFDFLGLLDRLLPALFPRLLCSLRRIDAAVQIITVYSNYALFAFPTQGQAQGDSARSQGLATQRQSPKLMVSLQPCAGGDLLRCCIRPRKEGGSASAAGSSARQGQGIARPTCSWRHADRLLHAFKDAVSAWMPRISFKAGIRCPICRCGPAHPVDLHALLQDDVACCAYTAEPLEDDDLPVWLAEWRRHLQGQSNAPGGGSADLCPPPVVKETCTSSTGTATEVGGGLSLDYLYASPLDASQLDVHAELRTLAAIPNLQSLVVRTGTTETLVDVWTDRTLREVSTQWRVLCLAAHCAVDMSRPQPTRCPALLLEDSSGCSQALSPADLSELLRDSGCGGPPFDVVVLDACHSLPLGQCFLEAGAECVVSCDGAVFDAAGRAFLAAFLRSLAAGEDSTEKAFANARRAVRLSPQPGLRADAARFRLLRRQEDSGGREAGAPTTSSLASGFLPPSRCAFEREAAMHRLPSSSRLPPPIEDFLGRSPFLASVAQAFLGGRRAVWLHGLAGVGKTAVAIEFCRFFGFPGDRLFSQSGSGNKDSGGATFVNLLGLKPQEAVAHLRSLLDRRTSATSPSSASSDGGQTFGSAPATAPPGDSSPWLLALDGIDEIVSCPGCSSEEVPSSALWRSLSEALSTHEGLRLLLISREPRYDAALPCKVVAVEVPPLQEADAAMLFLRRVHRPLYSRDLEGGGGSGGGNGAAQDASGGGTAQQGVSQEAPVLAGRKAELVQKLVGHPLLRVVGTSPGDVIAAASDVTPSLVSLLQHPALSACDAFSRGMHADEASP
eukprot:CAMPEP_0178441888 /NCGR_PEP_ID=MMETSP0689_2-20121128/37794_1 /TAXON_ID=160604 /ORGANISM="Amphidinium massartii, Strain CS-259" /LENGTH=1658 /DNA_ID=CAMNT_0020065243 /DNA_START=11 /DNA_END=4987 /DNA_ORIENTATION=+